MHQDLPETDVPFLQHKEANPWHGQEGGGFIQDLSLSSQVYDFWCYKRGYAAVSYLIEACLPRVMI